MWICVKKENEMKELKLIIIKEMLVNAYNKTENKWKKYLIMKNNDSICGKKRWSRIDK